ncbi:MAG: hypothetical protein JSU89_14140 [Myxococcales bacterium]|nr:MAG: hypothetical protein JSU89_14140 [Myxococcales bacterium]
MVAPKSTHLPEVSGATELVTGSLIVDTGLRDLQTVVATLAAVAVATEATVSVTLEDLVPGATRKIKLQVWNADGATPGASEVAVNWLALGK